MRVAVLAGGRSSEHDVSLASASAVLDGLEELGHDLLPVVIGDDGLWRQSDPRQDGNSTGRPVAIVPGGGRSALLQIDESEDEAKIDVVFPVLHGPFGEDGAVQGLLECVGVPYVGAGVAASALCMDKSRFKQVVEVAGLPQPSYKVFEESRFKEDAQAVRQAAEQLGYPLFVKPASLGSSVGISKVALAEELGRALSAAFAHDPVAVVEEAISGKEVECSVLGNRDPVASLAGEIRTKSSDWYDYEAKYGQDGMELIVPADIDESAAAEVRSLATQVFKATGCEGMARIDFFVTDERVLISELNSIPGFTPTSVFARLFEATGTSYGELLEKLLGLALERHGRVKSYRF